MNKKNIIWAILIIIILLVVVFGFLYLKKPGVSKDFSSPSGSEGMKASDVKSSVTSGVEKTNPFKADVNPYNGYKNPFAQ